MIIKDEERSRFKNDRKKDFFAGLYEFPNLEGHLTRKQLIEYAKSIGMMPVRIKKLENAKHIFSHVEWHMTGYEIIVDELEKTFRTDMIFADKKEVMGKYPYSDSIFGIHTICTFNHGKLRRLSRLYEQAF